MSALVPKLAARRTPLEDAQKAITEFLAGPRPTRPPTGKLLFAGLFDTLNAQRSSVMNGLERVTRKQREAADKIRSDTLGPACAAGRVPARPGQDRRTQQSTGLANPDLRGPAARDQIRLRGAHRDRPAAVRARPHDPAGDGIARSSTAWVFSQLWPSARSASSSSVRGSGCDSATGSSARSQPSVPSGYQATLG